MSLQKQPSPFSIAPVAQLHRESSGEEHGVVRLVNDRESVLVRALEGGIFEITANRRDNPLVHHTPPLAEIPEVAKGARAEVVTYEEDGCQHEILKVTGTDGASLQIGLDRLSLGLSVMSEAGDGGGAGDSGGVELVSFDTTQRIGFIGDVFGLGLRMPEDTPYYGFGEKTGRLNKHGCRMKFWNVVVCSDLPDGFKTDHYDPTYCSIPVAIWCRTNEDGETAYGGLLIDNSGPCWFNCQTNDFREEDLFYCGTYCGEPRFYFITGSTMGEVCRKLLRLTGTPEMPPLWSMANQQCRWGYDEERMYKQIITSYEEEQIPLHGLWLDIDYMKEYQVFTWHEDRVPSPERLSEWMHEHGVHEVTIVDPGVPTRDDNEIYSDGCERDVFCHSPSGLSFVGMVWPGKTAFPDFSLPEVREWWGGMVADHLARGVCGIWNDMNDPATGISDVQDMLFHRGTVEHQHYHNCYGTFMAEATQIGFRLHNPERRPFILTRSACTGIQRYAAVWTGDNVSSWAHLKMSIPETVNLALSGVSFNGADIGGFMDSTTSELLIRWYQAALLFPFYRNHSNNGTAHQEPWCFGSTTRDILRDIIVLRYRFLGQIYTEYAKHIASGEPMVRPLCYFSADAVYRDVSTIYALGDGIVVTPLVEEGVSRRFVVLPPGRWFDLTKRSWHEGGVIFERDCAMDDVPIYVREGMIIAEPIPESGSFVRWDCNLNTVHWRIHIYLEDGENSAHGSAVIDDGMTWVDGDVSFVDITYQSGQLSGSFPFDLVDEVTINGIGEGLCDGLCDSDDHEWIGEDETPLSSVLRPMPVDGQLKDHCRVYLSR